MENCSGHFQFSNIFIHQYLRVHLYLQSVGNVLYNHLSLEMLNIGGEKRFYDSSGEIHIDTSIHTMECKTGSKTMLACPVISAIKTSMFSC